MGRRVVVAAVSSMIPAPGTASAHWWALSWVKIMEMLVESDRSMTASSTEQRVLKKKPWEGNKADGSGVGGREDGAAWSAGTGSEAAQRVAASCPGNGRMYSVQGRNRCFRRSSDDAGEGPSRKVTRRAAGEERERVERNMDGKKGGVLATEGGQDDMAGRSPDAPEHTAAHGSLGPAQHGSGDMADGGRKR